MNLSVKQKQTHRHREQTHGERGDWEFVISSTKLSYIEWVNNKVLLYSTGELYSISCDKPNGKQYEKECVYTYMYVCICVYMYVYISIWITESLFWTAEISTTL